MGGPRPRARLLTLAAAWPRRCSTPVNPAAAADLGRHPDETTGAHPGDQLVPDPDGAATIATTLRRRTHYLAYSFLRHCGLSRW